MFLGLLRFFCFEWKKYVIHIFEHLPLYLVLHDEDKNKVKPNIESIQTVLNLFNSSKYFVNLTPQHHKFWRGCHKNAFFQVPGVRALPPTLITVPRYLTCLWFLENDSSFKGTVKVILSGPPCKDENPRFTNVPLDVF